MTQAATPTTLATLNEGDEILSITNIRGAVIPASLVTTGIHFPLDGSVQRLVVKSAKFYGKGKNQTAAILFTNGGFLRPCAANTPCTVATS